MQAVSGFLEGVAGFIEVVAGFIEVVAGFLAPCGHICKGLWGPRLRQGCWLSMGPLTHGLALLAACLAGIVTAIILCGGRLLQSLCPQL